MIGKALAKVFGTSNEREIKRMRPLIDQMNAFEPQMQFAIRDRGKRPLGIVVDASELQGVEWKARWEELRFLHKYSDHIARVALVGASKWQEIENMFVGATVLAEADVSNAMTRLHREFFATEAPAAEASTR